MSSSNLSQASKSSLDASELSWRDKRYERFYQIVDQLVDEIQINAVTTTGNAKRKLRNSQLAKLHYSVECLVRDCVAVVLQRERKGEASIKRGQHHYPGNRLDKMLTYSIHVERAFDTLLMLGYLRIASEGRYNRDSTDKNEPKGKLTRFVAEDRLIQLFTDKEQTVLPAIIPPYASPELIRVQCKQKDQNGEERTVRLPTPETAEVAQMRANLTIINNALLRHWYDLEVTDEALSELQQRLANSEKDERQIRLDQRTLTRVFNSSDLLQGGRFYGGWWQNIPKTYRSYLTVNGKRMVELDYSNQHPTILYSLAGVERPADCYSNIFDVKQLAPTVDESHLRKMIKSAFNAMLNSPRVLTNPPRKTRPSEFGLKWEDVSQAILDFHAPIAQHFYSGIGLKLQRIDSDIAEKVLLHFTGQGIPILPLHDSFLMHDGYQAELEDVMQRAFRDVVGVPAKVDAKDKYSLFNEELETSEQPVTDDIYELLGAMQGHDLRLDAFRHLSR